MDSKAILDYAVFHLTPTRTRCDLIIFRGKSSEKLASGLVDPFVTHLQYAKDQIPKGGYSITLRPPSSSVDDDDDDAAPWFTKATFQRFVRFVSTPEILERIMRLEREILQIETSLQSNEVLRIEDGSHQGEGSSPVSNGMTKKSTNSSSTEEEEDGSVHTESSKVQLQRLMDARKALLLKEQAMAYARAVVAGFEIETIGDLICFADAFGASRLRAACADFKDLYKKKHSDDQWMDELAAVQAYPAVHDLSYMGTPGIILAGENFQSSSSPLARTGSDASDGSKENNSTAPELNSSNAQQQMPWMNHQIPQYMYGYQMPYQGYPMPYFPGHVGFPPPKDKKRHKSSKKKSENSGDSKSSEEEEITSSDDSSSSDNDSSKGKKQSTKNEKKHKKGSKTVVIRNINYITSKKRGGEEDEAPGDGSSEDVSLDGDSIREGVDSAIASLERRNGHNHSHAKARKSGGNSAAKNVEDDKIESDVNSGVKKASDPWGAFQNLLLSREVDSASNDRTKNLSAESFDEHFVAKNSSGAISNGANGEFHLESEKIKKHPTAADDSSAVMIRRNGADGFRDDVLDFADGESTHPTTTRKKIVSEGENALFSHQIPESRSDGLDFSSESARKIPRGDDWWVANNYSANSQASNCKNGIDFNSDGDFVKKETSNITSVTDDSFIVGSTRSGFDDPYASQWKTDITATFDKTSHGDGESPTNNGSGRAQSMKPDELTMVLVRESHESTASWAPELDYAAGISFAEFDKKRSTAKEGTADEKENGKKSTAAKKITKTSVKDARSKTLSRSRLDSLAKSKAAPGSRSAMQKNKLQREEEERKRMEELVIQRRKRIAERTVASGNGLSPGASKKIASKTTPSKSSTNGSMGNGTATKSLNQSRVAG